MSIRLFTPEPYPPLGRLLLAGPSHTINGIVDTTALFTFEASVNYPPEPVTVEALHLSYTDASTVYTPGYHFIPSLDRSVTTLAPACK